jgi:hypothetical protein
MELGRGKASLRLGETLIYIRVETPMIKKIAGRGTNKH